MSAYITGIEHDILDAMVELGLATEIEEGFELTEEGKVWLLEWVATQLVEMGADIQRPLDGMDGAWYVAVDKEVIARDERWRR